MSNTTRIEALIQRYRTNAFLTTPFISPVARDASDLSVDQPAADLEPRVVEDVVAGLRSGNTHYVDVPGMGPVRDVLLAELQALGAEGFTQATTLVTSSVQEGRFLAIQTIAGIGGAIATQEVLHPGARAALGIRPLDVRTLDDDAANGFLPSPEAIEAALRSGARVVYLEHPNRLSGATFSAEAVAAIAASVVDANAHLIVDQGLAPWVDGFVSFASRAELAGRLTVIGEALPGRGLEGFGIGYLATSEEHVGAITKLKQVMSICTSTPSQLAVQAASTDAAAKRNELHAALGAARERTVAAARQAGFDVIDGGASAVVALRHTDLAGRTAALAAAGINVANGADFGAPDVVRVSITADGRAADVFSRA